MSVKTFLSIMRLLVMVTRRPVMAVCENSQSWIVMSGNTQGYSYRFDKIFEVTDSLTS